MNPDPVYQRLRELSWRRPLTTAETAELSTWLAAHPDAHPDAEAERTLTQALARLPDAPVPSNFTGRVWQTIEREQATPGRATRPRVAWWWRVFLPRVALAAVVLVAGLLVYRHHQDEQQTEFVKSFLAVASPSLADPKVMEDFDVICQLSPPSAVDEELLSLME